MAVRQAVERGGNVDDGGQGGDRLPETRLQASDFRLNGGVTAVFGGRPKAEDGRRTSTGFPGPGHGVWGFLLSGAAGGVGFAPVAGVAAGFCVEGAGVAVAGFDAAASNRLMTSAVMSSDGSMKMAPASPALKSSPMPSSFTSASTTGRSLSWNPA